MHQDVIDTILRGLTRVDMENSYENYHVPGIDYLCLGRDALSTQKVYVIDPSRVEPSPDSGPVGHHLALPHTHAYVFRTWVLSGSITQVRFTPTAPEAPMGEVWYSHPYHSSTPGTQELGFPQKVDLVQSYENYPAGGWYDNVPGQIHTLAVPGAPVVLFLQQMNRLVMETRVFSRKIMQSMPVHPIAYKPMSVGRSVDIIDLVIQSLRAERKEA